MTSVHLKIVWYNETTQGWSRLQLDVSDITPRVARNRAVGKCSFCSQRSECVAVSSSFTLFCLDHYCWRGRGRCRYQKVLYCVFPVVDWTLKKFSSLNYYLLNFSSLHYPKHWLFPPALTHKLIQRQMGLTLHGPLAHQPCGFIVAVGPFLLGKTSETIPEIGFQTPAASGCCTT